MATVVVTGSTKGIGRGLAEAFLQRGHQVVVCSRNAEEVRNAVAELGATAPDRCTGQACDISDKPAVQALWDHAIARFGRVDYWINNAGTATSRHQVHELPENLTRQLITSNLLGTTFGSQVAIAGFRKQGKGQLYNVLGGSFSGKPLVPNMGVYSATKAGIFLLTQYLLKENTHPDILIGMISPGVLISDNWFHEQQQLSAEEWQEMRPMMNIMADEVGTVAPWLVEQILANTRQGKRIAWMTGGKMAARFASAKLLGRKRDLFSRYGL
ncbi:MAG: SDR family oxidoreductase [Gammaproteobacteria bacterium]|jgi:NAD(P)-dependent dehydrogenase (short-subunit alcohol dehydrogenase family)|nr:SDR family oxidoreductase [Gammaproteobacteria bacterium]